MKNEKDEANKLFFISNLFGIFYAVRHTVGAHFTHLFSLLQRNSKYAGSS